MNEDRLRRLLRAESLPGAAEAESRGRALVERAYAERGPLDRPVLPRLAIALAAMTLLAGLILSPAGAAVRDWIGDAFSDGVPNAKPALDELPGGGQLLVQSAEGAWVVQADGSRRLLGRYREATWSPRGLFVATTEGRSLSALEPDGTPRWSISAGSIVSDPRWSPSGFRIAYRAGDELRVVDADGSDDRVMATGVAPTASAWFPVGPHLLAHLDRGKTLRVIDPDAGTTTASAAASPGTAGLAWSSDGSLLLERGPDALWVRDVGTAKLAGRIGLGAARRVPLPADTEIRAAAFAPQGSTIAVLLQRRSGIAPPRSEVLLVDPHGGPSRRLFAVSGELADIAWSPAGERLLTSWPDADQWLFLSTKANERIVAIDGITAAFAPGQAAPARFPRIDGWCCPATSAAQEAAR
jgi:hypothetical protein